MNACDCTRSSAGTRRSCRRRGPTSRPCRRARAPTIIARKAANPSMNGQRANRPAPANDADRPHPLGPDPVGELAERHGEEERHHARDGQAEADLGGRQPDDLGEEHRAAGEERALADREQHRLHRELPRQRRRREEPVEARAQGHVAIAATRALTSVSVAFAAWLEARGEPGRSWSRPRAPPGGPSGWLLSRRAVLASVRGHRAAARRRGPWVLRCPRRTSPGCRWLRARWSRGTSRCADDVAGRRRLVHLAGADPAAPDARRARRRPPRCAAPTRCCSAAARSTPRCARRAAAAGVRVVATYGSAETAAAASTTACRSTASPSRSTPTAGSGSAGRRCSTATTATPTLTAEVLVDGWFLTADAGRLDDDGRLQVLGRVDDVVVSGGVNVPGPAVAARLRAHPDVVDAEVLGVPDEEWGNRLVAFVVGAVDRSTSCATGWPPRTRARGRRARSSRSTRSRCCPTASPTGSRSQELA